MGPVDRPPPTSPELHLWFFLVVVVAASGCRTPQLVAAAVDYRAGVRLIEIREFEDRSPQRAEPTTFYNRNTQEGRSAYRRAMAHESGPRFTYALAHNVAVRLREADSALAAAGLPRPTVLVKTRADPGGVVATGARFGAAFVTRPDRLPAPDVRVGGSVSLDVRRSLLGELFLRPQLGALYPYESFRAAATYEIQDGAGLHREVMLFVNEADAAPLGLSGLSADPYGQLIARIADHLAPHEQPLEPEGSPLVFCRRVIDADTIEVDLGLTRRTLHIAEVHDLETPLPTPRTREALAAVLARRYLRIRFQGGPPAPARSLWRRVDVTESR